MTPCWTPTRARSTVSPSPSVRRRLTLRQKSTLRRRDLAAALADFRRSLVTARGRTGDWHLDASGFDALAGGLAKTVDRARKAMAIARDDGSTEAIHDWRKRVKYHWYHARLLEPVWPETMHPAPRRGVAPQRTARRSSRPRGVPPDHSRRTRQLWSRRGHRGALRNDRAAPKNPRGRRLRSGLETLRRTR